MFNEMGFMMCYPDYLNKINGFRRRSLLVCFVGPCGLDILEQTDWFFIELSLELDVIPSSVNDIVEASVRMHNGCVLLK